MSLVHTLECAWECTVATTGRLHPSRSLALSLSFCLYTSFSFSLGCDRAVKAEVVLVIEAPDLSGQHHEVSFIGSLRSELWCKAPYVLPTS